MSVILHSVKCRCRGTGYVFRSRGCGVDTEVCESQDGLVVSEAAWLLAGRPGTKEAYEAAIKRKGLAVQEAQ